MQECVCVYIVNGRTSLDLSVTIRNIHTLYYVYASIQSSVLDDADAIQRFELNAR